jgi:hypothetical protein
MKKFLLIFIFLLTECGYQPIFLNKNLSETEFYKITFEGDVEINRKIIESLSFKENKIKNTLNNLLVKSSLEIIETSKNSSGKVESYKSKIIFNLVIINQKEEITNKNFVKEFSYNTKDNKFELVKYQSEVKDILINKIIEDIILFMNI